MAVEAAAAAGCMDMPFPSLRQVTSRADVEAAAVRMGMDMDMGMTVVGLLEDMNVCRGTLPTHYDQPFRYARRIAGKSSNTLELAIPVEAVENTLGTGLRCLTSSLSISADSNSHTNPCRRTVLGFTLVEIPGQQRPRRDSVKRILLSPLRLLIDRILVDSSSTSSREHSLATRPTSSSTGRDEGSPRQAVLPCRATGLYT